tara:strand:- start:1178 stop:1789 length:612 start_codon:yes stop_codon:yes gene_type:complete
MAFISNGTTILDNGSFEASLGALIHIKTLTASNSSTLSFVDGSSSVVLDNTYPIYKFELLNIHSTNDAVNFQFNMSTDGGSNYNVTKTSTYIYASVPEGGGSGQVSYNDNHDQAQGTGYQTLFEECGSDSDQSGSGCLYLFNPSSTTFVKHFIARCSNYHRANLENDDFSAGYGNTTSSINAVRFQMSSGNFDGKIKLYGIKD